MRKSDDDLMKICIEFRVYDRRPVGRLRKTWLESVEADMAELEIDKEDVHDRKKWRRNVTKRKYSLQAVDSSCCANCVEPPRPQQWGPNLPFLGHALEWMAGAAAHKSG